MQQANVFYWLRKGLYSDQCNRGRHWKEPITTPVLATSDERGKMCVSHVVL